LGCIICSFYCYGCPMGISGSAGSSAHGDWSCRSHG
jgi:hypothetical protein